MSRPTRLVIDVQALTHNIAFIRKIAPKSQVIAMVKANGYGCGSLAIVRALLGRVEGFGVACLEEALAIVTGLPAASCVLFEGVFRPEDYHTVALHHFQCVIHQQRQLDWLLATPLPNPIQVWIKVNTGMNRLGFEPSDFSPTLKSLRQCSWVASSIGVMSHLACADTPTHPMNAHQLSLFNQLPLDAEPYFKSIANSAAILSLPQMHCDVVRPGIMLYGVSPFSDKTGAMLGLEPVIRLTSEITAIHSCKEGEIVGYGADWQCPRPSRIAIVAIGYGDGYPRHIKPNTPVWIKGYCVPIVGRVSMDMLTIDITDHPEFVIGDKVELWGKNLPIETIADAANTSGYELMCQVLERVR